ncbi:MAG TPA: hypothetical protein VKE22_17325 [Haliangiales bacterium]|nr:hypothetical protein [Haliangiales bacterium]
MTRRDSVLLYAVCALGAAAIAFLYFRRLTDGIPPLDDTYIHLQYAKLLAQGHPFHYVAGEGYTTGGTSPLYIALLAPFFWLGLGTPALTYAIGAISLAAAAAGAGLAAGRIAGGLRPALAAAGLVLACGSLDYNALSGMETGFFCGALMVTFAAAIEPSPRLPLLLALLPLVRPEGMVFTLLLGGNAALKTRRWLRYALAVVPFLLYLVANRLLTGEFSSAGLRAKSWTGDVYMPLGSAIAAILESAWKRLPIVFADAFKPPSLPVFLAPLAALGLVVPGPAARQRWLVGAAVVLGYLALNNSKGNVHGWPRYFVPLTPLLAILAAAGLENALRRWRAVAAIVPAAAVVALGWMSQPPWLAYYADESRIIAGKQVPVARAIAATVAPDERVLTMDVGAVAFLGGRPTYDIIGLTTRGIFPYSMMEVPGRIELLGAIPVAERPRWAALYGSSLPPPLQGRRVTQAGGFLLYEIDYAPLDAANRPERAGAVADRVDVADWASERAHGYEFGPPRGLDQRAAYRVGAVAGATAVDACRIVDHERLVLRAEPGRPAVLVVRTEIPSPEIVWNGRPLALAPGARGAWLELEAAIPADRVAAENVVEARYASLYRSYHYFLVQ